MRRAYAMARSAAARISGGSHKESYEVSAFHDVTPFMQ
jgi:hypothetical protein